MSSNAADGPALVAASVEAAIRANASVRTVAAVAAAVAGKVLSAAARPTPSATRASPRAREDAQCHADGASDTAVLLESLRARRRARRVRKNANRKAARLAKAGVDTPDDDRSAGRCAAVGETAAAAVPAQASVAQSLESPPLQPDGASLPQVDTSSQSGTLRASECSRSGTLRAPESIRGDSGTGSAGVPRTEPYAPALGKGGSKSRGKTKS